VFRFWQPSSQVRGGPPPQAGKMQTESQSGTKFFQPTYIQGAKLQPRKRPRSENALDPSWRSFYEARHSRDYTAFARCRGFFSASGVHDGACEAGSHARQDGRGLEEERNQSEGKFEIRVKYLRGWERPVHNIQRCTTSLLHASSAGHFCHASLPFVSPESIVFIVKANQAV